MNTALVTAPAQMSFSEAKKDREFWGRLVESTVGAYLQNGLFGKAADLTYWKKGNVEVDYVISRGKKLVGIEVKSNRKKARLPGMEAFSIKFEVTKKILVGADGIPLEDFFLAAPERWLE